MLSYGPTIIALTNSNQAFSLIGLLGDCKALEGFLLCTRLEG